MPPFIAKHRVRFGFLSVAALFLIIGLSLHPLVGHWAKSTAQGRGWTVDIGQVRLGTRGLWIRKIVAACPNVPGFRVTLRAVLLPWTQLLSHSTWVVYGGTVQLPEALESLREQLTPTPRDADAARKQRHRRIQLSGLDVNWLRPKSDNISTWAWGVSGEIASDELQLTVDRIESAKSGIACLFVGTAVGLSRASRDWEVNTLRIGQARVELHSSDTVPPAKVSGANPETAPRDAIERFVDRLNELQRHTQSLRELVAHRFAPLASVEIPQVDFRWFHGLQKLDIGPLQAQAKFDPDQMKVALEQRDDASNGRRYVELRIPMRPSRIELESEIGFVSLQSLGVKEADFGLTNVDAAKLRLSVKSAIDELTSEASVTAAGEVLNLSLQQPWLASRPVEGINGTFSGSGVVSWKSGYALKVTELSLGVGQARLAITGDIQRTAGETRARLDLSVPLAACEGLIESLPTGLAPLASQIRLDGTVTLQAGLNFDTAHPERTDAKWDLTNGCRVKARSSLVAPEKFREPFILEVPDARGVLTERAFGPGTASWVSLADMSPHLTTALLVCEDGRFFYHNGFDSQAIRSSIRDNLLKGRFIRGGSTLSMQLAKNLYLRREKTFSRKLQEAALTLLLEQSFSKSEILELYWNVVELGPGIYGVGEASRFHFGTTAATLSPAQAYYLASILPNPKSLHFSADGRVSTGWTKQVRRLLTIAHSRHYLSDEELRLGLEEELRFGVPGENSQPVNANLPSAVDDAPDDAPGGREHEYQ